MDDDDIFDTLDTRFDDDRAEGQHTRAPPEKHLDSPIVTTGLERIAALLAGAKKQGMRGSLVNFQNYIRSDLSRSYGGIAESASFVYDYMKQNDLDEMPAILTARYYPRFFSTGTLREDDPSSDYYRASRPYDLALKAYLNDIADLLTADELRRVTRRFHVPTRASDDVKYWACRKAYWSEVVEKYRHYTVTGSVAHGPIRRHLTRALVFSFSPGIILVKQNTGGLYFDADGHFSMTYEQLQMIQDAVTARFNVVLALHIRLHNGSDGLAEKVAELIEWEDRCLERYSDGGYDLVKSPEAMFKTRINTLVGGDILPVSSYSRTLRKMRDKELTHNTTTPMMDTLDSICRQCTDIRDCAELFGLTKVSGHPAVDPVRSAAAVRNESQPYGHIESLRVIEMTRCFKHMVLSGYINRHTRWPPFNLRPRPGTTLRRLWQGRVTSLPINAYPLSDLDHIEFGQIIQFDYSEDYLKFLDDKAIGPGAQHTASFWFGGSDEPRRLLLKALSEAKIDMRDIVQRLSAGGFTRDELIVELTQKERELKPAARCFCKLPLAVRCYFTLLEYNLGEHFMSKYIPQQTMTMSAADTKKRLFQIATATGEKNALLEIDFSRWNLRWREHTVHPISRIIEDLFGMPGAWSQAHPFFFKSTIVLTDKNSLPEGVTPGSHASTWRVGPLVWRGHRGGFEGIQQKLWTLCTIAMVYCALTKIRASFIMAGQGDNQILAISFMLKGAETRASSLIRLLGLLELVCSQLNHEVKPEECIDSSSVITYSKELYAAGSHVLYTLKFASRTFGRADSDIPSLSAEIATLCSASGMVANTLLYPLKAFFWQCIHICMLATEWIESPVHLIERRALKQVFRADDPDVSTFALLLPGSLGGLPIQAYTRFMIRGEVDSLTWDVTAVKKTGLQFRPIRADLSHLVAGRYTPVRPDLTQLIADPQSIPIQRPTDARRLIKEAVTNAMSEKTRNCWIRELVTTNLDSVGDALRLALSSARPLYPDIFADLHKASLAGLCDSIRARFNMTRTIAKLVGGRQFLTEIRLSNQHLLRFVRDRYDFTLLHRSIPGTPKMVYDICSKLRRQWSPHLNNATVGTYCPLDFPLSTAVMSAVGIMAASRSSILGAHLEPGPYPPNFGTRTREKVSSHGFKIITSDDTVRDLRTLVTTNSELRSGPSLRNLISGICQSRSPWSLDTLEKYFPTKYGGTGVHRHARMQLRPFATMGSNTIPTHLNFSSDRSGTLCGGEEDVSVVYQEFYLYLNAVAQTLCQDVDRPFSAVVQIGESALEPIPDAEVDIPTSVHPISWPSIDPSNRLAYVSALQFSQTANMPADDLIPTVPPPHTIDTLVLTTLMFRMKYRTEDVTRLHFQALHAVEPIDIKELSRIPPARLVKLLARAIALTGAYYITVGPDPIRPDTVRDTLYRLTAAVAPGFVRMFLHPSFKESRPARELGITLVAGQRVPHAACANLEGDLLETAYEYLVSGQLCHEPLTLVVCEDTLDNFPTVILACEFYRLLRLTGFRATARFHACVSRLLTAERVGWLFGGPTYAARLILEEARNIDIRLFLRTRDVSVIRRLSQKWPVYVQRKVDVAVLTRELRLKPTVPNIPWSPPYAWTDCPMPKERTGVSRVEHGTHLRLAPLCLPSGHQVETLSTRRFIRYLYRTHGRYASAYTPWKILLSPRRNTLAGTNVLVVGVGRGAVARVLLELGATRVIGLDLRSTFPPIVQREFSYTPQEVVDASLSDRFVWADECFSSTGDVFEHDLNSLRVTYRCDFIIVDIESKSTEVLQAVSRSTGRFLLRVHGCPECISSFTSCAQVIAITYLDPYVHAGVAAWLLDVEATGTGLYPGLASGPLVSPSPFLPCLPPSDAMRTVRVNDLLRPAGVSVTDSSRASLVATRAVLRQAEIATNDITRVKLLRYIGSDLDDLITCLEVPDASGVPQARTARESVFAAAGLSTRRACRTSMLYLANTSPEYIVSAVASGGDDWPLQVSF